MPSRELDMVKFNESGDCLKVGEYFVSVDTKYRWWRKLFPFSIRIMVYSDTGGEQKYWHGQWWKV